MSITWMDNFKLYGTDSARLLDGTPWISLGGSTILEDDPDPNASGKVLRIRSVNGTANYAAIPRMALATPATKVGIAFRAWLEELPEGAGSSESIHVKSTGNAMIYHWEIRPNGSIQLYRGTTFSGRTLVADSVAPVILAGAWNHLEMWIDTVTGEYWFYKEGFEIAALTDTDGSPPSTVIGIVGFAHGQPGSGTTQPDFDIKDLILADDNGTQNNTPGDIGPVALYTIPMVQDVSGAWVPSSGVDMYAMVDDTSPADVDSISADDTLPAAAVMEMDDLPDDIVSIRAVQMFARMRKSDGGDATVQMSLVSNAVEDNGTDRTITTAYTYYHDISELDPDTAAPWTPTAFNAADFKIDRTL